jgi:hypothetical protein
VPGICLARSNANQPDLVIDLAYANGLAGEHGADRPWLEHGKLPQQLVGLLVGCPATVVEAIEATVLVSVIDTVASDPGDTELTAQRCRLLPKYRYV